MTDRIQGAALPRPPSPKDRAGRGPSANFAATLERRTPLGPSEAAAHLHEAWKTELGNPPPRAVGILWAQWALETGRGKHMRGFNYGGLKGTSPEGKSAVFSTREGFGETEHRIRSRFRVYDDAGQGARDYVRTLATSYPEAIERARAGDAAGFSDALARARYFTASPDAYKSAIVSLEREYTRVGPVDGRLRAQDPGPLVEALLHSLGRVIARRAAG